MTMNSDLGDDPSNSVLGVWTVGSWFGF